jgi:hypothetical protein
MALTLAQAANLSNNIVLQGIVETIVSESPVLQVLPFIESTNLVAAPTRCAGRCGSGDDRDKCARRRG